jgi:hypothetical protein
LNFSFENVDEKSRRLARIALKGLFTLTTALSHPMGEGESCAAGLKNHSVGFAERSRNSNGGLRNCSLSRRTGEGQGEGRCEFQIAWSLKCAA